MDINSMLFFPRLDDRGIEISIVSRKHFYIKLAEYVKDNKLDEVEFTYRYGDNGLFTIWCHHHIDDKITKVYLVGLVYKRNFEDLVWRGRTLPVKKEGDVLHFPEYVEKILDDGKDQG